MRKTPPHEHLEALRRLRDALEAPPCNCPIRRLHTPECDARHKIHDAECNQVHVEFCPTPIRGARGDCECLRRCSCPFNPADPDKRRCDCLLDLTDRCRHVLSADNPAPFDALRTIYPPEDPEASPVEIWMEFLRVKFPGEYQEPPEPPLFVGAVSRQGRVTVLSERIGDDPDRPRYGLRRVHEPLDRFQELGVAEQTETVSGGTGRRLRGVRKA